MQYKFHFTYKVNNVIKTATQNNIDFNFDIISNDNSLKVLLMPNKPMEMLNFYVEQKYDFLDNSRFFANGFQSWTDTKEFVKGEHMASLGLVGKSPFGKAFGLKYVGDYTFTKQPQGAGQFHSFSFAYVKNGDNIDLIGSLNDRTGYTIIYADMNNNTLRYSKDLEGVVIDNPYEILDLYFTSGKYDDAFDAYFDVLGVKPLTNEKIKGYTSWYNYYQNINENVILRDLNSLCEQKDLVNTFQVDDGYQTAVGDWLSIDYKKFPNGMKNIADSIHSKGLQAGIWLAPFGAQKGSAVAKEHPDWLIKNKKGKPI
jgi:alpha-galactosidase